MLDALRITAAATLALAVCATAASAGEPHWGYPSGHDDPAHWGALSDDFAACSGAGHEQSPIDIRPAAAVPARIAPVELHWTAFTPEVVNNGHTVQVNANGAGGYAVLDGTRYDLLQLHFHHVSEHTIDGRHSPMEVHLVGRSEGDRLLVVGAMIEPGAESPVLAAVWPLIPAAGAAAAGTGTIDPAALVPAGGASFRYAGSLTTPPCSEIVTWNVMANPITASEAQIAAFATLFPDNYRPTQDLARRFVLTPQ